MRMPFSNPLNNQSKNRRVMTWLMGLCVLASGCAHTAKRANEITRVEEAMALRGQTYDDVVKKIGQPVDRDAKERAYWFLSEGPRGELNALGIRYVFLFSKDRLVRIDRADSRQ